MEYRSRLLEPPEGSFFLFGPRGTGKSTWLRHRFPQALFVDLLHPARYRELSARPELLAQLLAGSPHKECVVLDEVQRVPELLNVAHDLMEGEEPRRFVLTGSSARKLRRGGVDLLAGRAVLRHLHPFLAAEVPDFRLEAALELGMVPLVRAAPDPADTLRAYASLYLEEEVRTEGWVRNLGDFARFLEAVALSHACVLNISNIARECQVQRKTAAGYLEVLEDLLLCHRVPIFTRRAKRKTAAHPKLYLFDAGVFRALRPRGPLDQEADVLGPALEGLVAQHLRAWIDYGSGEHALCTWRTPGGTEIDFIVYGERGFWAVEVKRARRVRPADLRSLRAFGEDYPESRRILLYGGSDRIETDGVLCLPVEEFLRGLVPGRLLHEAV